MIVYLFGTLILLPHPPPRRYGGYFTNLYSFSLHFSHELPSCPFQFSSSRGWRPSAYPPTLPHILHRTLHSTLPYTLTSSKSLTTLPSCLKTLPRLTPRVVAMSMASGTCRHRCRILTRSFRGDSGPDHRTYPFTNSPRARAPTP